jgi:hypothetical protein
MFAPTISSEGEGSEWQCGTDERRRLAAAGEGDHRAQRISRDAVRNAMDVLGSAPVRSASPRRPMAGWSAWWRRRQHRRRRTPLYGFEKLPRPRWQSERARYQLAATVRRVAAHTARDVPQHCLTKWPPSRRLPRGPVRRPSSTEVPTQLEHAHRQDRAFLSAADECVACDYVRHGPRRTARHRR